MRRMIFFALAAIFTVSFRSADAQTGNSQGPGGVGSNLKLWLRADDPASLVLQDMPAGGTGGLRGYPDASAGVTVPAVSQWKDTNPARNHVYAQAWGNGDSGTEGTNNAAKHLYPVYQPSNYMTNYHPAVRFWTSGTGTSADPYYSTWLGTSTTDKIWSSQYPTENKHSAFFLVNNHFGKHDWIYPMMFSTTGFQHYGGPGYGVQKSSNNVVGRFRTVPTEAVGTVNLFTPGATSILEYHHAWANASGTPNGTSSVKFRFNGEEDAVSSISHDSYYGMNNVSVIGTGYEHDRTIQGVMSEVIMYDGALHADSLQRIESYLAIKYGITLTPGNHATGRFDYVFSNGRMLWNGTAASGSRWADYYHRVAAVIRDDAADLNNRQSHSTNVGSILHMGVAGSRLSADGDRTALGDFAWDTEAVIWGDNNSAAGSQYAPLGDCGDFDYIFERQWLVHKLTRNDRPVQMLVGAQNNAASQLGQGAGVADLFLFDKLTAGYSVCMIVADSPDKLNPLHADYGKFTAIVPMQFLDGEQQCIYTFADSITYVTFGYRQKSNSCVSTARFEGTKTFEWTQWTRQTYGAALNSGVIKPGIDLGDSVEITDTRIEYQNGVVAPALYPSVTGSPVAGSLYLQRRVGALDSKVVVTVNLLKPVLPEFSIYDIDGWQGRFERITVTGYCNGGVLPTLSYAGSPDNSFYRITGNSAVATVSDDLLPGDRNGQLDVAFHEGVTQIVIEYQITGLPQIGSTHNLIISPLRFRQVPPSPPVNEDGLSFVKNVREREISSCEPVEYIFLIGNVNCDPKFVHFRDTLPSGMKWTAGIGQGSLKPLDLSHIHVSYGMSGTLLQIDSLYVPGTDVLRLTATATVDEGFVGEGVSFPFDNHAWIRYSQLVNSVPTPRLLKSVDGETLVEDTRFTAIGAQRQDTVRSVISTDLKRYSADTTVAVTLTVTNPNTAAVTESFLDVHFDAGFTYVSGSLATTGASPLPAIVPTGAGQLSLAGIASGVSGFTIPAGVSTYTFRLKAPALAALVQEIDLSGNPTGGTAPLTIDYVFSTAASNRCIIQGMIDVAGLREVPYSGLIANSDQARTMVGVEVKIPVLANDSIPAHCAPAPAKEVTDGKHGTASFAGDSIRYTPESGYIGLDTLRYTLSCDGDTARAYVYVTVNSKPDNIVPEELCYLPTAPFDFKIVSQWSARDGNRMTSVLTGDMDSDGLPEIVAYNATTDTLFIRNGQNGAKKASVKLGGQISASNGWTPVMTALLVDADGNGMGELIVTHVTRKIMSYEADTTGGIFTLHEKWATPATFATPTPMNGNDHLPQPVVADFDGDGTPELVVFNQIYNALTGDSLGVTEDIGAAHVGRIVNRVGNQTTNFLTTADFDGDGLPEIVAGGRVYKVHFNAAKTRVSCEILAQHAGVTDGYTAVADVNMDGNLDVVVANGTGDPINASRIQIWTPATGYKFDDIPVKTGSDTESPYLGYPFIGDIDGKIESGIKYPEICVTARYRVSAFRYNPGTGQFVAKWVFPTSDDSGGTGITLFDFNNDGVNELVYRDQNYLRVLNGVADNTAPVLADSKALIGCLSGTAFEYPVIADTDGDGSANICVTCSDSLLVYESGTQPWAPTRKVWNQVNYEPLQINEDLTVPRFPTAKNTAFGGKYPYNGSLIQVPTMVNSSFSIVQLSSDPLVDSLWTETDVPVVRVHVRIKNQGVRNTNATLPVALYGTATLPVAAGGPDYITSRPVGANIAPGETYVMYFELPSESVPSQMSVRIQDDGVKYLAEGSYLDCDSTNNTGLIGYDQLFDDVATVQAFRQVEIDVLANDKLPSGFPPGTFSLLDSVPPGYRPLNGTLSVSGSKLVYTSAGTEKLTNHIDSFTYRLSFVSNGVPRTDSATVYIYVLYDENGASACPAPQSYTAVLTEKPAGVTFNWYLVGSTTTPIATGATYNFGALAGDASREVKPVVPGAGAPWNRAGGFPPGRFTVHATGTAPAPMRWTGIENSDWFNPANWVEVRATYETPVSWTPSRCTNVVISSGAPNYPELSGPAFCAGITMEDRAMLKNPHALNYDSARVEVRFSALEYDRFVMWSAPLRDMYSGDYHFTDAGGRPRWGDVAINYFQQDNPHGGEARANMFTATFGEPGEPLGLGKAFNLRVTATSESRSQPLIFPQKATGYEYTDPASGSNLFTAPLSRSNSRLFITDGVTLDAEERFEMTVPGISGGEMVQIVNPYLAYLRADSFLEGNRSSSTLATSGYLLWDGKVDNSFVAVKFAGDPEYREGMRYMATRANALSSSPEYIPPLQSFFVVKNSANATVNTVKMSPRWTTTKLPGAYQLLMSEAGSGVLRIRATQGRSESYAALHFDKNQAAPEYRSSEDVRALFYDANPLTVYVLTPLGEPLAISADGEYESHTTPLGLRLTQSGEVTLEFSGLAHFGHNVYLVDREQNREIDLQQTPAYTFMAVKPSGVEALELNDRFVLRMEYTGVSSEPAPVSPTWTALPLNGEIHVRAVSGLIRSLQVYNVLGAQVYATQTAGDHYRIPVERGQIYIVRADINGVGETKKVIVN